MTVTPLHVAHRPTEDHPLADSLVLSLAVYGLSITITTQSATNGGVDQEQSTERDNRAQTGMYCTILWTSIGEMWAIHPPSLYV